MMQKTQFFLGDKSRILKSENFIKKEFVFSVNGRKEIQNSFMVKLAVEDQFHQ